MIDLLDPNSRFFVTALVIVCGVLGYFLRRVISGLDELKKEVIELEKTFLKYCITARGEFANRGDYQLSTFRGMDKMDAVWKLLLEGKKKDD